MPSVKIQHKRDFGGNPRQERDKLHYADRAYMESFIGRRECGGREGVRKGRETGERGGGAAKTSLLLQRNSWKGGQSLSLKGTFCVCLQSQGTTCHVSTLPGPQGAGPDVSG